MERKIVSMIQVQTEILFKNVEDQLLEADLECVLDGVNNSRYLFHMLHSMDKYFINPYNYTYEVQSLLNLDEAYSIIDDKREGYIKNDELVISREILQKYFEFIKNKVAAYLNDLQDDELSDKPEGCPHSKLDLILGQYRHIMFHLGISEGMTVQAKNMWPKYTGFTYIA